jgi:hypothetical protein
MIGVFLTNFCHLITFSFEAEKNNVINTLTKIIFRICKDYKQDFYAYFSVIFVKHIDN